MAALLDLGIELLTLDVYNVVLLRAGRLPIRVFRGVVKRRPEAFFFVFVGLELDLFRIDVRETMWVDGKEHLVAVVLAMDEGNKEPTGLWATHILQDTSVHVVAQ